MRWCATIPVPFLSPPTARYTENGQRLNVGDGLWRSVKAKGKYRLFVSDVEAQQAAFIGTLEEHNADATLGTPVLVALRLKIAGNEISEVEQFIARNADAAKRVESLGRPRPAFTASRAASGAHVARGSHNDGEQVLHGHAAERR